MGDTATFSSTDDHEDTMTITDSLGTAELDDPAALPSGSAASLGTAELDERADPGADDARATVEGLTMRQVGQLAAEVEAGGLPRLAQVCRRLEGGSKLDPVTRANLIKRCVDAINGESPDGRRLAALRRVTLEASRLFAISRDGSRALTAKKQGEIHARRSGEVLDEMRACALHHQRLASAYECGGNAFGAAELRRVSNLLWAIAQGEPWVPVLPDPGTPPPAESVSDEQIAAYRDDHRAAGDLDVVRCCSAALGIPTGDGALGMLDAAACRARVSARIATDDYYALDAVRQRVAPEKPASGR